MAGDMWSTWLGGQRFGGGEREGRTREELDTHRQRVVEGAQLDPGATVLDIGSGDGLIGFTALEQLGDDGHVIFSDISSDLLEHSRSRARERGELDRSSFITAAADDLDPLPANSVDAVTMRSVLIYVENKVGAFEEFARVLKPGGRLSMYEPIHDMMAAMQPPSDALWEFDIEQAGVSIPDSIRTMASRVRGYQAEQGPSHDTAREFDGTALIQWAEKTGFIDLTLDITARHTTIWETMSWDEWLNTAWGPGVPTKGEALDAVLTPAERQEFEAHVRPLVEERSPTDVRRADAYLNAAHP